MFIIGHVEENKMNGREVLLLCPVGTSGRGLSCLSPTGHVSKGAIMSVAHWAPQEVGYHVCRPLGTSARGLSCLSSSRRLRKGAIMSVAHWASQEGGYHVCNSDIQMCVRKYLAKREKMRHAYL